MNFLHGTAFVNSLGDDTLKIKSFSKNTSFVIKMARAKDEQEILEHCFQKKMLTI
jgi:hypothetical protein